MLALLVLLAAQTTPNDEHWEQLKTRIRLAPHDVATFIERRTGCNHFDGEVGSGYPERERKVQDERKRLRCDQIEVDGQSLRKKYRDKSAVLRPLKQTEHLLPS